MSRWTLLTEFFPPHHGGIEDTLGKIASALGHEFLVIAPPMNGDAPYDHAQSFTVERRSLFSGASRPHWWWLVNWLRRHRSELVIFGHYSAAVTAGRLARRFGQRYAVIVHGHDVLSEKAGWRGWLLKMNLGWAEWVGVNSSFMIDHVHQLGVPLVRIVVLHPMLNETVVTEHPKISDQPRLITVCRLVSRKNIVGVLRAVAALVGEFPQLHYDIIGDGQQRTALEDFVIKKKLQSHVTFYGRVNDEKKWSLLRQASVGVMVPTANGSEIEGFGLFFIEAGAAGLPVVGSWSGGVIDAVEDGVTGTLVAPDDELALVNALRDLLHHPNKRQIMGQAGIDTVRREFLSSVRLQRLNHLLKGARQEQPPLVSVVIPTYQSADTIGQTLADLFDQTWTNLEVIVVNDGSTDNLKTALQPFIKRIQLIEQTNQGAAAARNAGAAKAMGEFILFLDADIRMDRDMIGSMVVALQTHRDAAYAYSNFQFGPKGFRLQEFNDTALRQRNYIHTSSLIRRVDFPGFDSSLKKFQDWDLWLTMLAKGRRGLWIPKQLFRVQQRSGGYSTWLPRFVYRLPFIGQGKGSATIAKYRQAEAIIHHKHG